MRDLRDANQAYQAAYKLSVKQGKPDFYPLQNSLVAEMILDWQPVRRGKRPRPRSKSTGKRPIQAAAAEELLSTSRVEGVTFWSEVNQADFRLIEMLRAGNADKTTLDGLAGQYAEARKLGNRRKFASVLDQIRFLEAMAGKLGRQTIMRLLADLTRRLE